MAFYQMLHHLALYVDVDFGDQKVAFSSHEYVISGEARLPCESPTHVSGCVPNRSGGHSSETVASPELSSLPLLVVPIPTGQAPPLNSQQSCECSVHTRPPLLHASKISPHITVAKFCSCALRYPIIGADRQYCGAGGGVATAVLLVHPAAAGGAGSVGAVGPSFARRRSCECSGECGDGGGGRSGCGGGAGRPQNSSDGPQPGLPQGETDSGKGGAGGGRICDDQPVSL